MGNVILVEAESAFFANVLTAVSKTAAAGVGHLVSANGTFVAGDVNDFNYVGIVCVTAHSHFYSFSGNCPFLVYTATHGRTGTGEYLLGDIDDMLKQGTLPRMAGDLSQYLVFQMLYFCIKFSHCRNMPFLSKSLGHKVVW